MRMFVGAIAAVLAATAGAAQAQVPLEAGKTPMILTWTPAQQAAWYPRIETVFKVNTIRRGKTVHPLPRAAKQMAPTWTYDGKDWTVERYMAAYNVSGLLVIKDGKILLERYAMGRKPADRWTSFSVAKSVTSTLVGAAIQDGKLALDAPVTRYFPELKGSAYDGATVENLITMSSGLKWNEDYADPNSDVARSGAQAPSDEAGINPIVGYLKKLPRAHEPGTTFNYNTGETDLVGMLVARAVGKPISEYASEKIWKPYGMEQDAIWMVDGGGMERGGCCISMTLRDYGRVGQFILDDGVANGKRILPKGWVADATRSHITSDELKPGGYGYFWWIRNDGQGTYDARGIYGQSITTFPKDRVIVVVNSAWGKATGKELSAARNGFIAAAHKAAVGG